MFLYKKLAKVVRRYVVSKLDALAHVSVLVLVVDVQLKERRT